jgi:hypothetical protein
MRRRALVLALAAAACRSGAAPGASDTASADSGSGARFDAAARLEEAAAPLAADPCDRTGSLDARAVEARALYGPDVRTATLEATFLIVDPDRSPLFDEAARFATRVLAAYRNDRIGIVRVCPVSVYLFASHPRFLAHATSRLYPVDAGSKLGVYDPDRREIIADVSGGRSHLPTIAHELAHPLMDADFAAAPRWFRECVGTLFEAPVLPREGEIHGTANWRYAQLRAAVDAGDPDAHLAALFGMTAAAFRGKTDAGVDGTRQLLHYGAARAACQWLDDQGKLWPFYRAWRDSFAEDPDGRASFTRTVGQTPAEADAAWREWVRGP